MVPMARTNDYDTLELQLKETIQSLYQLMVQVTSYDATSPPPSNSPPTSTSNSTTSRPSRDVLASEIRSLEASLQAIHRLASTPAPESSFPKVPDELITYVDGGRNPDIYTRQFVEMVRRTNQVMKGKQDAFRSFRDVLAGEMDKAMPELREDTARVVAATSAAALEVRGNEQ